MTTSKGALWGITAVLMALLILSATTAAVYYGKYQTEVSQSRAYAGELDAALESYRSLQVSYNASLADYNQTISLLAAAVADLNTSTPAYREAGVALATLWSEYRELASSSGQGPLAYEVRMLVDYGNGTSVWYNDTAAQPGWNGYVVTLVLLGGDVQSQWYPQYGEHYVTGLGGVNQTSTTSWFVWELAGGSWARAQTGVDQIQIRNGTIMAWTLCAYDINFNPGCEP